MSAENTPQLLAHIVSRFTNRSEDVAVEALAYILSRSAACRRAIRDLLQSTHGDVGTLVDAKAQVRGKKAERPDLVLYGNFREERVLVEAKFWAGLTGNQPDRYLDRLPADDIPSALLFVAPEARLETLWSEICRSTKFKIESSRSPRGEGTKVALVTGSLRCIVLVSWRTLLGRLQSSSQAAGDGMDPDIRQLSALCEQQDEDAFLPIKPGELAPEIPRRLLHLNRLVNDAVDHARTNGFANTKGLSVSSTSHGHGRYLRLGSKECNTWAGARLGVNFDLWASFDNTPLWVSFSSDGWESVVSVSELRGRINEELFEKTGESIPVHLETGVEYETVLQSVVERLKSIATRIACVDVTVEPDEH